jgi:hypothetical protein
MRSAASVRSEQLSAKLQFHRIVLSAKKAGKLTFLMIRVAARAMGRPLHSRPTAYTCLLCAALLLTAPWICIRNVPGLNLVWLLVDVTESYFLGARLDHQSKSGIVRRTTPFEILAYKALLCRGSVVMHIQLLLRF